MHGQTYAYNKTQKIRAKMACIETNNKKLERKKERKTGRQTEKRTKAGNKETKKQINKETNKQRNNDRQAGSRLIPSKNIDDSCMGRQILHVCAQHEAGDEEEDG
jgi:hypothetical protein